MGVMCDVLPGEDEVGRGADGTARVLPGPLQPHVPQLRPAALRAQSFGEYHHHRTGARFLPGRHYSTQLTNKHLTDVDVPSCPL